MAAADALRGRGLVKRYGRTTALAGVDVAARRGERLAVFGHNGAGKTTLLKILAGLARPTSGRVEFAGGEKAAPAEVRRRLGFISHETLLYDELTGRENLAFYARLYALPDARALAAGALARAGLDAHADLPVGSYSRGMQQRLALARATLHEPEILLLDEPFTGLDPGAARGLTETVAGLAADGKTVVFTTHDLEAGYLMADRLLVLRRGRVVCDEGTRPGGAREFLARSSPWLAEARP